MSAPTEITPELLAGFLDEAPEYLEMLDAGLMEFESQAGTGTLSLSTDEAPERMNSMFRAAHSLKGLAAAFGFDQIKELTHRMETLFDHVRMGKRSLNGSSFELLFRVFDRLKALIAVLSDETETEINIDDLLAELDVELQSNPSATDDNAPQSTGSETASPPGGALPMADNEILNNPELLSLFIETTIESLDEMNEGLLGLERNPGDSELLNSVFRCAHNIKGASGAAGFAGMNRLTHELETAFDRLRNGTLKLSDALIALVFRTVDRLRSAVEELKAGNMQDIDASDLIGELEVCILSECDAAAGLAATNTVTSVSNPDPAPEATDGASPDDPGANEPEPESERYDEEVTLSVAVTFAPDSTDASIQAFVINNKLADIGTVVSTTPDLDALDLDEPLLAVTFIVQAAVVPNELKTLVSAYGVSSVTVERTSDESTTEPEAALPDEAAKPGQQTKETTAPPRADSTEPSSPAASKPAVASKPSAASKGTRSEGAPRSGSGKPTAGRSATGARSESVPHKTTETLRVDQERLDQLMNLGGELVINRARFTQIGAKFRGLFNGKNLGYLVDDMNHGMNTLVKRVDELADCSADPHVMEGIHAQLKHLEHNLTTVRSMVERVHELRTSMVDFEEALHGLTRVSDGIQKGIMGTRMVPVGPLFSRFRRVVRDICKSSGKKVELVLRGEHTELDKRMIDELGDPLTHMVRNSVDHGIEMPEVRVASGKPEVGTVILEACHRGNSICIEVTDDGAGVNIERVKQKIIEGELATEQQVEAMSEHELVQYVFKPGFSTAATVTDLSGRGMGMDIVINKIDKLSGSVDIESKEGQGAHVTIKLPLTLAILTSMVARIGDGVYAVPLETVAEIITVKKSDIKYVQRRAVIQVRERIVPIAFFEDIFGAKLSALQTNTRDDDEITLVIIGFEQQRIGLVVDELYGQEDVVIKSIAENYRNVRGIAGASIRGDGTVSLILDVGAMLERSGRTKMEQPQVDELTPANA